MRLLALLLAPAVLGAQPVARLGSFQTRPSGVEAAATKPFGFMRFYPGPGLGGHCIPVDPLYLSWKLKTMKYEARFIELADDINSHMPHLVVEKTQDALNDQKKALNGSNVLIRVV